MLGHPSRSHIFFETFDMLYNYAMKNNPIYSSNKIYVYDKFFRHYIYNSLDEAMADEEVWNIKTHYIIGTNCKLIRRKEN